MNKKNKVGIIENNGKKLVFKIPEKDAYYIDFLKPVDRKMFAKKYTSMDGSGLADDGNKYSFEKSLEWVINSEYPLIIYKDNFCLSRVKKGSLNDAKVVKDLEYISIKEAFKLPDAGLKQLEEIENSFKKDLIDNNINLSEEKIDEFIQDYEGSIYTAYRENDIDYKEAIITAVKEDYEYELKINYKDKDVLFRYFNVEWKVPYTEPKKNRIYEIINRENNNFRILKLDSEDNLNDKFYTLSSNAFLEIKELLKNEQLLKIDQEKIYETFDQGKEYDRTITNTFDIRINKKLKSFGIINLWYIKDKTNNEDVKILLEVYNKIYKIIFDETSKKIPLK